MGWVRAGRRAGRWAAAGQAGRQHCTQGSLATGTAWLCRAQQGHAVQLFAFARLVGV